ncbi:hypothetical protein BDV25DRAFT_91316 [Aspergillus avenaceus]|uniref:Uncharacterized protein n=1 Tax=Aspergillus avenaceus TaxID=36643 RepID=A0A5N6TZI8_ASPAV|nr:hypothetical protein BDV25DRAFT_91316 [Aspergillus avenaceus]
MTTSPNPTWVLKKKTVLVSTPDPDVSCLASLRIAHDETANQGSISLRISADLANLGDRSQVLTLNVPPEIIEECTLARMSDDDLCPSHLVAKHPASVANVSVVSTLCLKLSSTGIVLCPSGVKSLSPANQGDLNFHAFAKICKSQSLRLHIARRQFVDKEFDRLRVFAHALQERNLQAESFDHARQRVVQKDWRVFSPSLEPPLYCEEPVLEQVDLPPYCEKPVSEQVVRKRHRDSIPPDNRREKIRLLSSPPPIDSPTEANTPSTLGASPSSICRTNFTRAYSPGRAERNKVACLVPTLSSFSDDQIRELLIQSGRRHLLALPEDVDSDRPSDCGKINSAADKMIEWRLQRCLKQYIDEVIERRLKLGLDQIFDEYRDLFYNECKTNEVEFHEHVDDGNTELRCTANECMEEMDKQVQEHMRAIDEQARQYMDDIEDRGFEIEMSAEEKVAELKRRFNAPIQDLLDNKSSPSHVMDTNARRSSV